LGGLPEANAKEKEVVIGQIGPLSVILKSARVARDGRHDLLMRRAAVSWIQGGQCVRQRERKTSFL